MGKTRSLGRVLHRIGCPESLSGSARRRARGDQHREHPILLRFLEVSHTKLPTCLRVLEVKPKGLEELELCPSTQYLGDNTMGEKKYILEGQGAGMLA